MNGIVFELKGNWGHFRKPETNNNPLTHDLITKTALIGLVGAVLGIERGEMKGLFPQLSEDLVYGVCVKKSVKKESWAFTLRYVVDLLQKAPKPMEFLKNPEYKIVLALRNQRSTDIFDKFSLSIQQNEAIFTPILGLHNCPAEISWISAGQFKSKTGDFSTCGFVKEDQFDVTKTLASNKFRIGLERIPTFQNNDFWNLPDKYEKVIYPSEEREVFGNGDFYEFIDGSQWTLI